MFFAASFEAGNVGFKANFRYTNKHKSDVQRQLLLAIQRQNTLESLYKADPAVFRGTKRKHSYLESVKAITHTNEDGTVDMLLSIAVATRMYDRFNVMWSAHSNNHVIHVPGDHPLLLKNSVRCFIWAATCS